MCPLEDILHLLHGIEDPPLLSLALSKHRLAVWKGIKASLVALAASEAAGITGIREGVRGHFVQPVALVGIVVGGEVLVVEGTDAAI